MILRFRSHPLVAVPLLLLLMLAGCIGPEETRKKPEDDFYARFPAVDLSEDLVHSPTGDMTARLPEEWVRIDVAKLGIPDIFAMACNREYTLAVVFTELRVDEAVRVGMLRNGLRGVAEVSFARKVAGSNGRAKLVGPPEDFAMGLRKFSAYTYTTDSARTITRVAVFATTNHIYECAVTHMTFKTPDIPSDRMLRDVQQVVLGGIEW